MINTVKLAGTALIFTASAAAGFRLSEAVAAREKYLRLILMMLERISDMIEFTSLHSDEIIISVSEDSSFRKLYFLRKAAQRIKKGENFADTWRNALNEDGVIGENERDILQMMGDSLGSSGRKGQLAMLELYRRSVRDIIESQADEMKNKRKLFSSLGVLAGAMISVLLI